MKKLPFLALLLCMCVTISACAGPAVSPAASETNPAEASVSAQQNPAGSTAESNGDVPGKENPAGELVSQINALRAKLDTSRLPLEGWNPVTQEYNRDEMPPQLIHDEDEAYYLAQCVNNLLFNSGNILNDFDDAHGLGSVALKTAVHKTTQIEYAWEVEPDSGVIRTEYPDHVLTELLDRETKEGHYLSGFYYAEDVAKTMTYLFGTANMNSHIDGEYSYYQSEKVYARFGDFGGPYRPYAQITSYEKTTNGYVCEAVIVRAVNRDFPMHAGYGAEDLTWENFEDETLSCGKFRYTFEKADDGHLVLTAFKILRSAAPYIDNMVVEYPTPDFTSAAGFKVKSWPTQALTRCALISDSYSHTGELNFSWDKSNFPTLLVKDSEYLYTGDFASAKYSENITTIIDGTEVQIGFSVGGPMSAQWTRNGYAFALSQWKGDLALESFQERVELFVREVVMEPEIAK